MHAGGRERRPIGRDLVADVRGCADLRRSRRGALLRSVPRLPAFDRGGFIRRGPHGALSAPGGAVPGFQQQEAFARPRGEEA